MLDQVFPKSNLSIRDNLKWLFILRNLMLIGESILIIISVYALNITLPQEELWSVIFSICAVNLYTWMRLQTDEPVSELEIFSQISIDVFALGSLLYLTCMEYGDTHLLHIYGIDWLQHSFTCN
jgi:two-component system sensor histidine kinase RegB